MSVDKEKKRPVKELRDQLRRDQIVSAARGCVVRHGFHAASMGQIAAEAHMSVGQIYRYFPSKEAIVHAIVERIVARRLEWMVDRDRDIDFPARFANRRHANASEEERSERVLLLEITAEATRNPAVADIVREADRRLRGQAVALVRGNYPELNEEEAAARVEFVTVLSEGSAFRTITEDVASPVLLEGLYREVLKKLFPRMTERGFG
ncbi:MAG TPA: TetR/AcrR family transcriptional regulator [Steroidobacter sp.]